MISPIHIAVNGYLSTTLSISVDGYLGHLGGARPMVGPITPKTLQIDKRRLILEDDKEVLLFIKIFSRWL